ncbi:MAG: GAF domain-containing protein [Gammaproteobacteria bacterium]|nr:MAG: GAF domain-containing protein [Gammaproteobacteria bacterium]
MKEEGFDYQYWIFELFSLSQRVIDDGKNEIFEALLRHIIKGFNGKTGTLALRENEETLKIEATADLHVDVIGKIITLGSGVLGWVAQNNTPLLLNGVLSNDERFQCKKTESYISVQKSSMCWPLFIDNRVIGAISINKDSDISEESQYTESDLEYGRMMIPMVSLVVQNALLYQYKSNQVSKLTELNEQLSQTQNQLVQQEKMASIGQLAAGVAHEINNPIGFVLSNVNTLAEYAGTFISLLKEYETLVKNLASGNRDSARVSMQTIRDIKKKEDVDYMLEDIEELVTDSLDGMERVRSIVAGLKSFARVDTETETQQADINECIQSTLKLVWNELKYNCKVETDYGEIPEIECFPGQLNQVFMNLMVNASHAIEKKGLIKIKTFEGDNENIIITITDNGSGIEKENISKLFNPFFTTKEVGKGTGLGLSISYGIIEKHNGTIDVESTVGEGTTFTIKLPIAHRRSSD